MTNEVTLPSLFDASQDSFSEIARLLTDFFRDLDLVPTDIVAGLVLLRKQQKKTQQTLVGQVTHSDGALPQSDYAKAPSITDEARFFSRPANAQDQNDIYEFLSGVPITSRTRFLSLHEPDQLEAFQQTAYYMKYALAAYGWPMYLLGHSKTGLCRLTGHMRYVRASSATRKRRREGCSHERRTRTPSPRTGNLMSDGTSASGDKAVPLD